MLLKVSKYIAKLKNKLTVHEEETISKEEILAGIDAGLKDMIAGRVVTMDEMYKELGIN